MSVMPFVRYESKAAGTAAPLKISCSAILVHRFSVAPCLCGEIVYSTPSAQNRHGNIKKFGRGRRGAG